MREELARHLMQRFHFCGTCAEGEPSAYWLRFADEVIRQMEWAREQALREFVSDDAKETRPLRARLSLSLAPQDWTP